VTILPSTRGFGASLNRGIGGEVTSAGTQGGKRFGGAFNGAFASVAKAGVAAFGAVAIGSFVKGAVTLEAQFSKTMNVLQATTNATGKQMQSLSDLAMKMGADTVFSANDASKAMLELARGGITTAQIQAGALRGTMTLAAAGELDMGEAANTAVKAMGAFNLQGKDMGAIAAALAGGANASSASVSDMSQALAQGGLAAANAGLSIQETTGILAAFSNAGLEGSDAGTSLKTFLTNLQPATKTATEGFHMLGLSADAFVKKNGEFKSAADIAGILQRATAKLSDSERTRALTQAFGTDAQRAANVMAQQGAKGLEQLIKQTSDQGAANKMAAANMKGTAGAMEAFKGSVETLQLQLGKFLAPAIQGGLHLATEAINGIVPALTRIRDAVGPVVAALGKAFRWVGTQAQTAFALFNGGGATVQAFKDTFGRIGDVIKASFGGRGGGAGSAMHGFAVMIQRTVMPAAARLGKLIRDDLLPAFEEIATPIAAQVGPALVAFGGFIQKDVVPVVETMANTFQTKVLPAILGLVTYVVSSLLPIGQQIATMFLTRILPGVAAVAQFFYGTLYPAVVDIVTAVGQKLRPVFDQLVATVQAKVLPAINRLLDMFQRSWPAIQRIIQFVVKLAGWLLKLAAAILAKVLPPLIRFAGWLIGKAIDALSLVIEWVIKIIDWLIKFGAKVGETAQKVAAFAQKVKDRIAAGVEVITNLKQKVLDTLTNIGKWLFNAGKALIQGLIDGVKDKAGDLVDAAKDAVGGAIDGVKGLLKIGSPSRVFHEIGDYSVQGLVNGLSDTSGVDAASRRLAAAARPNLGRFNLDAAAAGAAAGGDLDLSRLASMVAQATRAGTLEGSRAGIEGRERRRTLVAAGGGVNF
jgi:TP901 family phage tail tape measure protein